MVSVDSVLVFSWLVWGVRLDRFRLLCLHFEVSRGALVELSVDFELELL